MNAIEVPSNSDPTKVYRVTMDATGRPYCPCPAWLFHVAPDKKGHKICRHLTKKVLAQLRKQLTKEKPMVIPNYAAQWVERYCVKCKKMRYTLPLVGFTCLRCGSETK